MSYEQRDTNVSMVRGVSQRPLSDRAAEVRSGAMNLQEFAALKVGDAVENPMNGPALAAGTVVEITPSGIRVVWGKRHDRETKFFYSVNTTAWMHWTAVP